MIEQYLHKFFKVVDKRTNQVLASNKVVIVKNIPKTMISLDYAYFFSIEENPYFYIEPSSENEIIKFNPETTDIKVELYRNVYENPNEYIYREFTLDELDPEIKDLVFVIRDLGYWTTGSCCGHGTQQGWIDIMFYDFDSIKLLADIIDHRFKYQFCLTTDEKLWNYDTRGIYFKLKTTHIGEEAYKDIKELTKYLKIVLETKNH